ncbi:MAG: SDR family NAD(P)-dependent oxidoreductase [Propionibacteriaceae bacterium]|nr:SDR family NAD(P)-dependent oxidoreductase [Propionibacteriaceae bacterium]
MPTIVVAGAGPGLGRSTAHRYGREGYQVVLVSRRAEPLEAITAELRDAGIATHPLSADLSDPDRMAGAGCSRRRPPR